MADLKEFLDKLAPRVCCSCKKDCNETCFIIEFTPKGEGCYTSIWRLCESCHFKLLMKRESDQG